MSILNRIKALFGADTAEETVRYIIGGEQSHLDELMLGEEHEHVGNLHASLKARVVKIKKGKAQAFKEKANKAKGKGRLHYIEEDVKATNHFTPNDPTVSAQWHLTTVKMFQAWDIDTGANAPLIANIDSGVDLDHPELVGNLIIGPDYATNDGSPDDEYGHGTATCGTTAAKGNNGIGIAGIVWGAKTLVIRALDATNYGYYSWWANAMTYAADHGAKVLNMSMGGTTSSTTLQNGVNYVNSKGCILVVSAGNAGSTAPNYPAACTGALAISASDQSNNKAGFSSYGSHIFVAAPGVGIPTLHKDAGYASWSGTSFSAPIVTGIVALLWSKYPSLTRQEVIDCIRETANNKGLGFTQELGYGIVDAYAALQKAATLVGQPPAPDTTAPTVPTGISASDIQTTSFTIAWNPSTDNVGVTGYEVFANGVSQGTTDRALFGLINLTASTLYSVQVRARDAAGNWSGLSNPLSVTTSSEAPPPEEDTTKPSTPTNLVATGVNQNGFNLSWTASIDNVGVTAYQILVNGAPYAITTSTSLKITGLENGVVYNISVRARDAAGNWSDESDVIQVILTLKKKGRRK